MKLKVLTIISLSILFYILLGALSNKKIVNSTFSESQLLSMKTKSSSKESSLLLIGAGNVGYPLLHALVNSNGINGTILFEKIIILDAQAMIREEIDRAKEHAFNITYIQGDMRDAHLLHQIFNKNNIRGVIILAAISRVMWCEMEKETCKDVNTHATKILLEQIKHSSSNPWIIFASSREVYGGVNEFPITEQTPMNPLNLYGETKMESENILSQFNEKPLNRIILRFSSIYGGKYDHNDRLIPSMIRSMLSDQPIPFSGANQEFDFTHVQDVVEAILLSIRHLERLPLINGGRTLKFNICSGELTSVSKLYRLLKKFTNSNSPSIVLESNNVFPAKYQASTQLSQQVLGFKARITLVKGLLTCLHQIYLESFRHLKSKLDSSIIINEAEAINSLSECIIILEVNNQLKLPSSHFKMRAEVDLQNNLLKIPFLSAYDQFKVKIDAFSRGFVLLHYIQQDMYYDIEQRRYLKWDLKTYPLRIHVHCCPHMPVKNLLAEYSPYFLSNYQSRKQETSYNAKLTQSLKYKENQLVKLHEYELMEYSQDIPEKSLVDSTSSNSKEWSQSSKIYCESDCNNIIPCLKSDDCRCVINEQCSHQSTHLPSLISSSPRYDSRMNVLSIYGKNLGKKWPNIHVHEFKQNEHYLQKKECNQLTGDSCCFSMDAALYHSFKNISVSIEQADIVLLPHFQGCALHYEQDKSGKQMNGYILNELNDLKAKYPNKIFASMASHDFGGCDGFWWSYFEMSSETKQSEGYSKLISIQPNGDFFSKCYIPEKDIVAPPRTCLTNKLIQKFSKSVKNVLERKHLVFFEGSVFGTGEVTRATLKECENIFGYKPKNQYPGDYLEMLSETKFCPLVSGTSGWATRNSDVIYAGCIPVYISEYTHQPFSSLLDYSTFSIKIHPSEVFNLKSILENIPHERMLEMQRNLIIVRDLMIYKNEDTVQEWSPQDMILRSLYLKMKTFQ